MLAAVERTGLPVASTQADLPAAEAALTLAGLRNVPIAEIRVVAQTPRIWSTVRDATTVARVLAALTVAVLSTKSGLITNTPNFSRPLCSRDVHSKISGMLEIWS